MRILLDECVPKKFGELISEHSVTTVPEIGWASIRNGELLELASDKFDVLITVDKKMAIKQNPSTLKLPVVILKAKSTQLKHIRKLIPQLIALLQSQVSPGFYSLSD